MKYVKHEGNATEGFAVGIQARGYLFWIDVIVHEEDVLTDWNQYIFDLLNEEDLIRRKIQEDCNFFMEITSFAVQHLEHRNLIKQDSAGKWHYC